MATTPTTRAVPATPTAPPTARASAVAPQVSPRKRGAYRKSAVTRQAILDAALEVFGQGGFHKGSLREIAARVSMSEAGMLHHFRSKAAMLAAVLEHRDDESRTMVDFDAPDPRDALKGIVAVARHSAARPGVVELFCILSAEATDPTHPAHEYFQQRYAYLADQVGGMFRRLDQAGLLVPGTDPQRAARFTIALWDGLQVQWLLDRTRFDVADELEAHLESLIVEPPATSDPTEGDRA